ncbi:hypothetical protein D0962_01520 [Leptolyngbyaceae cyanobacterium CCMR0082]|uniref:CheW-like domain-containing protein n=1 Tax=Adonisia turfae CCMR0082 TaxID=2304604 RepID=A0A6M0RZ22_9CYAN|nr:chemotaxis protein CheW [Adonisia turfae]MDV3349305.1 chemotaxis protein CheW [Leptothoe sp. LEGE 181152]NEZ61465.1 hypothetical protein [Adonisia turfae CCMR0082]
METSYCLFEINQCQAAVDTAYVEEVFALPELVLIPNAPLGVIGVLDRRGDTLPIVDLQVNSESQPRHYHLSDSIIVLQQADLNIGIIVNSVQGIKELSASDIKADMDKQQEESNLNLKRFFSGMVTDESDILILNSPQAWFKTGEIQQVISVTRSLADDFYRAQPEKALSETQLLDDTSITTFAPAVTPEDRAIFHQRAKNLRQSLDEKSAITESRALIVVSLGDNLFGIDSNLVREFITISQATPVPCCPKHIIGAINLRGKVLVVIDITQSLGLPLKALQRLPKAIVVEYQDSLIAIVVEEIRDALFSATLSDIQEVTDNAQIMGSDYAQGQVPYGDQIIQILDLPKLLDVSELIVSESF